MITCTLPTSITRADDAAWRIYRTLAAAGRLDLAVEYAGRTWNIRDAQEAIQRAPDELAIVWVEA